MIQIELKLRDELIGYARKIGRERGLKKGMEGVFLDVYINSFAEGFIEGYKLSRQKIIIRGIKQGYSNKIIANLTDISIEEIQKIRQQLEKNK
ncbi:MAG: hypothetical protein AB8G11_20885 [Saprospiraceae bacterium]